MKNDLQISQRTHVKYMAQFKQDQKMIFIYPLNLSDNCSLLRTLVPEMEGQIIVAILLEKGKVDGLV